jgi:hypothetical protein
MHVEEGEEDRQPQRRPVHEIGLLHVLDVDDLAVRRGEDEVLGARALPVRVTKEGRNAESREE